LLKLPPQSIPRMAVLLSDEDTTAPEQILIIPDL
jgi:hypothetical protein